MKIIVPMAGRGSRLRPHTLTVPKPLVPIAGKPIVQRLVEDITKVCGQKVDEIAFVIGDFGDAVEKDLLAIAESLGAKGSIYHQEEALGTAHAILCAKDSLEGPVVVAFADTLFRADFTLDSNKDGINKHWHRFCGHDKIKPDYSFIEHIWETAKHKYDFENKYKVSKFKRVYCNAHTHGVEPHVHKDDGDFTMIYYPILDWEPEWLGGTALWNEQKTEILKFIPDPYKNLQTVIYLIHKKIR